MSVVEKGLRAIARKAKYDAWLTADGLLRIEGWARDGLTDAQIAHNVGCSYSTFREWRDNFPALAAALKNGKAPVDLEVENALLKRALGFEYEETVTEITESADGQQRKQIRKVKKTALPDVTAQIFWLKNRRPDKWRDKPEATGDANALVKAKELLEGVKSAID